MQYLLSILQLVAKQQGSLLFHLLVMLPLLWVAVLTFSSSQQKDKRWEWRLWLVAVSLLGLRLLSIVSTLISTWSNLPYNFSFFISDRVTTWASIFLLGWAAVLGTDAKRLRQILVAGLLVLLVFVVCTLMLRPTLTTAQPFYAGTYLEWMWSISQLVLLAIWLVLLVRQKPPVWQAFFALFAVMFIATALNLVQSVVFYHPIGGEVAVLVRLAEIITHSLFLLAVVLRGQVREQLPSAVLPQVEGAPIVQTLDLSAVSRIAGDTQPEQALLRAVSHELQQHTNALAVLFCVIPKDPLATVHIRHNSIDPDGDDLTVAISTRLRSVLSSKPIALDKHHYPLDAQYLLQQVGIPDGQYWFWVPCQSLPNASGQFGLLAIYNAAVDTHQRHGLTNMAEQVSALWQRLAMSSAFASEDQAALQQAVQLHTQAKAALHLQVQNLQHLLQKNQTQYERQIQDLRTQVDQLNIQNQQLTKQLENSTMELQKRTVSLSSAQEQLQKLVSIPADWQQQLNQQTEFAASQQTRLLTVQEQLDQAEAERERLKKEVVQLAKQVQHQALPQPSNTELAVPAFASPRSAAAARQAVDIAPLVDRVLAELRPVFKEKSIALRLQIPDELPTVFGDPVAIHQIMQILLRNAGAASPAKSQVTLYLEETTHGRPLSPHLQITVRDSGTGIATSDYRRVFLSYGSATHPIAGLGETNANLALLKNLVDFHKGDVWIESDVGKGSEFNVLLPLGKPSEAA